MSASGKSANTIEARWGLYIPERTLARPKYLRHVGVAGASTESEHTQAVKFPSDPSGSSAMSKRDHSPQHVGHSNWPTESTEGGAS